MCATIRRIGAINEVCASPERLALVGIMVKLVEGGVGVLSVAAQSGRSRYLQSAKGRTMMAGHLREHFKGLS